MPTYEYACAACGHQWEQVQRIVEAPIEVCPKCAAASAHRLISGGTNFILKGGGWYSDLYSSPKAAAKTESTPGGSTSSESGGKSESAPSADAGATKTETKPSAPSATPAPSTPSSPTS